MTSLVQHLGERVIGTVEEVTADRISVLLDPNAPQATALNTGVPAGFPRLNGYVLIPNESGATACVISSVRIERLPFPKRKGTQQDFGLVDLPFPSRLMNLTPLGTLRSRSTSEKISFEMSRGVDVFPSVGDPVMLPTPYQLEVIVQGESQQTAGRILLGCWPTAGRVPVHVDPNKLFGRHLAVLGNTGAGKSCTVAGLIRWSLDAAKRARSQSPAEGGNCPDQDLVPNARFIVLDPNGEYARAFSDLEVRLFSVEPRGEDKPLRVPAWLWNGEEWSAFTGAAPGVQRPVLFEALRRLRSGLGPPDEWETKVRGRVRRYQDRVKVLIEGGDHQKLGHREGVANVLLNIKKDFGELANDSDCTDKNLREGLQQVADNALKVEIAARSKAHDRGHWHNDFPETDLEEVAAGIGEIGIRVGVDDHPTRADESSPISFPIDELPAYVDALAADQSGRDIAQFVDTMKLRIHGLLGGRLAPILKPDDAGSIELEDWLTDHVGADQAEGGPVAVIDLSLVPSEVIHVVVSVLARMIFEALQRYRRERGEELPTTLVLEEAHTFISRDLTGETASAAGMACARVFERIAREGRKFGLGLVLSSQRPSEVSPTVLSQCNTFLLHRLVNDRDQDLVKRFVPDGLGSLLRELPSLPTRRAILLGWAAPTPTLVEVQEIPEGLRPHSPDPSFWEVWTGKSERSIDWRRVARRWQSDESGLSSNPESEDQGLEA